MRCILWSGPSTWGVVEIRGGEEAPCRSAPGLDNTPTPGRWRSIVAHSLERAEWCIKKGSVAGRRPTAVRGQSMIYMNLELEAEREALGGRRRTCKCCHGQAGLRLGAQQPGAQQMVTNQTDPVREMAQLSGNIMLEGCWCGPKSRYR